MAVKDATEHRIDDVTKLLREEVRSENPDMDRIARLEKELAADTKSYSDMVRTEVEADNERLRLEIEKLKAETMLKDLELKERLETSKLEQEATKLELEARRLDQEADKIELERSSVEVANVKNEVEDLKSRRQWRQDLIRTIVMAVTTLIGVVLPVLFDRYREQQLNARFLLSQNTEKDVPYLTVTDKEAVRQGLADNTGRGRIALPWK